MKYRIFGILILAVLIGACTDQSAVTPTEEILAATNTVLPTEEVPTATNTEEVCESKTVQLAKDFRNPIGARWSPDGNSIAFVADINDSRQVVIQDVDSGETRVITANSGYEFELSSVDWFPNSNKLLASMRNFYYKLEKPGYHDVIFEIHLDDALDSPMGPAELQSEQYIAQGYAPEIAPDGRSFLYLNYTEGSIQENGLFVYDLLSNETEKISPSGFFVSGASWSPDGTKIAYSGASLEHGKIAWSKGHIYLYDVIEGTTNKIVPNDIFGGFPIWSPDGQYIAFSIEKSGIRNIIIFSLVTETEFQVTNFASNTRALDWNNHGQLLYGMNDNLYVLSLCRAALIPDAQETPVLEQSAFCIGNMENFAWDPPTDEYDELIFRQRVYPQDPWQHYTQFDRSHNEGFFELQLAREQAGNSELWVFYEVREEIIISSYHYLLLTPKDGQIEHVSAEVADMPGVFVSQLFLAQDGSIWGVNEPNIYTDEYPKGPIPILSKFDETARQFKVILNSPKVVADETMGFRGFDFEHNIALDKQDRFWMYVTAEGVYRYDIASGEMELTLEDGRPIYYGLSLGNNGELFMSQWIEQEDPFSIQPGEILVFDPPTNTLSPINPPSDVAFPYYEPLHVDRMNRLWIGAMGWWNINNDEWHLLHTHLDEYFANVGDDYAFEWRPPFLFFESSNGYIWFRSYEHRYNGTAWLDPDTGDSCWFTSYPATMVEDHNQKLWLLVFDQLYYVELSAISSD
ncbi:MAG: PD40 domain-containing protein [Anaerolineales bacterium]|nr:PD40 domain-containing protein [Anaerolineales bacterium]